ncbi:CaiB/BaiF CoA transferase family protein [Williamsia muralis]|uniref:Carnitine dehydratase n=1 Tax=Williamsia marianensis TaxID=85044 RepID=A0A2G3PMR6_WILMA|nr:CaiB/BaiF CoA-transferase family protein [Williamsia marianensis]PHV67127.1 carnitine dehydratase [Williamsia marianensis]
MAAVDQRALSGVKVLELRSIGPGPLAGMLLADMGADVIRVDRPGAVPRGASDKVAPAHRGKRSVSIDLKSSAGRDLLLKMVEEADVLIEGSRPGVMERLGLGPSECLERNPRLVYGRMTGWGQDGPLASAAGHDINYVALSGALDGMGSDPAGPPVPAVSYVGDFGGGTMFLIFGVLCALRVAEQTGVGQVVDASMVDGVAALSAPYHGLLADNKWHLGRGRNVIDGGAPFYHAYKTGDDQYVTIASAEPQFYQLLRDTLGLTDPLWDAQHDEESWKVQQEELARIFRTKTRSEWCDLLEGTDVCFAPVLSLVEAPDHPHNVARGNFLTVGGVVQPAPAPRLSSTPGAVSGPPPAAGAHTREVLLQMGLTDGDIDELATAGAVAITAG